MKKLLATTASIIAISLSIGCYASAYADYQPFSEDGRYYENEKIFAIHIPKFGYVNLKQFEGNGQSVTTRICLSGIGIVPCSITCDALEKKGTLKYQGLAIIKATPTYQTKKLMTVAVVVNKYTLGEPNSMLASEGNKCLQNSQAIFSTKYVRLD